MDSPEIGFGWYGLSDPPECVFNQLACRVAQLRIPKLLACNQTAVNNLPERSSRSSFRPSLLSILTIHTRKIGPKATL